MSDKTHIMDITNIRKRARQHVEQGAVTDGYKANRKIVIKLLNEALATEIICVLRYKRHYFMVAGINAQSIAAEFIEHANEELGHIDLIAQRIAQLDGEPNFSPQELSNRAHSEYMAGNSLLEMMREDLIAERIAIDSYREMIDYLGEDDPTTRRVMEEILAVEEKHAGDLSTLLEGFDLVH